MRVIIVTELPLVLLITNLTFAYVSRLIETPGFLIVVVTILFANKSISARISFTKY